MNEIERLRKLVDKYRDDVEIDTQPRTLPVGHIRALLAKYDALLGLAREAHDAMIMLRVAIDNADPISPELEAAFVQTSRTQARLTAVLDGRGEDVVAYALRRGDYRSESKEADGG